ncbi:lysozyme family protein [Peribacillus butanolivorans]|uniref:bifunctional lytic transglycosylase/C40 family peptidase n=1 Tax=Peribacillus TaxID=2675229 RepID=UPI000D00DE5B|nr:MULTISPECIES: bifunctional lytic transglycosylase/C40 family peptidase [Peribacillus]MCF7625459.1 bifunctional lysozyme/C40 family peptidase [Peribacillus frigoritolerans]PRA78496.1 endopeptidase [Peribacillus simplex]
MFTLTTKLGLFAAKEWKWVIGGITIFFVGIIMMVVGLGSSTEEETGEFEVGELSAEVLAYRSLIEAELKKYGMEEHTLVLLAILQQENGGGLSRDIFQASESLGLPPNSITDPLYSIQVGVKHFAGVFEKGKAKGVNIEGIVQSYNFGGGYIDFLSSKGGKHSEALAKEFSSLQMEKNPGKYTCGGDTNNFRYPYCYGDWSYTTKVFSYISTGGAIATGSQLGQKAYETLYKEILKYEGFPYTWGGSTPATSFDCSGLTSWAFKNIGYSLPRTAQEQYKATKRISKDQMKPGDLIFFKTASYNDVTHVGIYVGNNKMFDANNGGIGFSQLNNYWNPKIVGYGRVS